MQTPSSISPSVLRHSAAVLATALAGALLLSPVSVQASPATPFSTPVEAPVLEAELQADDVERARKLEARAEDFRNQPDQWKKAARLYQKAAELRPADDHQKVLNLQQASLLLHYVGDDRMALTVMEEAAEVALRRGDVVAAAEARLDAAWLAGELKQRETAREHLEEARILSSSPLLGQSERSRILHRIG